MMYMLFKIVPADIDENENQKQYILSTTQHTLWDKHTCAHDADFQHIIPGPLLLTWIIFNLSIDK